MSAVKSRLELQLQEWVAEDLISREQALAILARTPVRSRNSCLAAYAIIGAILCVTGISLLLASNWQEIPALLKLTGVLLLLSAGTITAVETQKRGGPRSVWECGYLVAAVFPLLGLMLVSQIFHLSGSPSGFFGMWLLLILPLAVLGGSGVAFFVGIVAAYAWLAAFLEECFHFREMWWVFTVFAGAGAVLGGLSQLWLLAGRKDLRAMGEFIGVATVFLALWLAGFDITHWFALWATLFLGALGWIALSTERGRIHQVNLGFAVVALLIISTFLRLVGTMAQTGQIFLGGGVVLLVTAWGVNRARREVLRRMS
jgi:uncharacterized membrane protein